METPLDITSPEEAPLPSSSQTLCVIRVFTESNDSPDSPHAPQSILSALASEIDTLVAPWSGAVLESEGNGLALSFSSAPSEPRADTWNACRVIPTLLQQLSTFRLSRPAEEQPLYHFGFAIVAFPQEVENFEAASSNACTWATLIASISLPDQILMDQLTFQELARQLPSDWKPSESESSEGEQSQRDYLKTNSSQVLPESLRHKSYHLRPQANELHSEGLNLYYTHSLPLPNVPTPLPILRLYSNNAAHQSPSSDSSASAEAAPGETKIGRFTLISVLGVGGMGQVWKARDNFGNFVALKMMLPGNAAVEGQLARFRREAEIMSKLPHHNICRIFEVGDANGISYIAMELVEGISLHDLLHYAINDSVSDTKTKRSAPTLSDTIKQIAALKRLPKESDTKKKSVNRILPIPHTISLFCKVCDALQFAHDHNILHRDLKPANIMLREDGEPVVMDFGLGKLETEGHDKDLSLTMSGAMLGTVQYISPEQALSSRDVDGRADVYSLGAILYEMVTGNHHFTVSGSLLKDAQLLQDHEPQKPRLHNPSLESDLEIIVLKSLHAEVDRRYRSPSAFSDDLDRYRHGEVITAKPVSMLDIALKFYKRNKPVAVVTFISAALLIGLAIFGIIQLNHSKNMALEQKELAEASQQKAEEALKLAELKTREAVEANQKTNEALLLAEEEKEKALHEKSRAEQALSEKDDATHKMTAAERKAFKAQEDATKTAASLEEEKLKLKKAEQDTEALRRQRAAAPQPSAKPSRAANDQYRHLTENLAKIHDLRGINFAVEACNRILNEDPKHVGALLLLAKLSLAENEIPNALGALQKIASIPESEENRIEKSLASQFADMLAKNMEATPDFFDENKGEAVMKRINIIEEWSAMDGFDRTLAQISAYSKAKPLFAAEKLAIIKFFKSRENP